MKPNRLLALSALLGIGLLLLAAAACQERPAPPPTPPPPVSPPGYIDSAAGQPTRYLDSGTG